MKKQISIILVMIALALNACVISVEHPPKKPGNDNSSTGIRVFADMTLKDALSEIAANYALINPDSAVQLSFSNPKHLREVIEQGTSVDLFVSGIPSETKTLTDNGYINSGDTKKLSTSRLVVAVPAGNPENLQSAQDLSRSGLKLGMAVETKPLGQQTRTVLDNMNATYGADYMKLVMANVTLNEEDTQAILTKLQSGEINACIVNSFEAANKSNITLVELPSEVNVYNYYDISILAKSTKHDQADNFMNYIFSPEGQAVLTKWGFTVQ